MKPTNIGSIDASIKHPGLQGKSQKQNSSFKNISDSFKESKTEEDPEVDLKKISRDLLSKNPPSTLWKFELGCYMQEKPVMSPGGHLYLTGNNDEIHVIDARDGAHVWQKRVDKTIGPIESSDGSVIVFDANWDSQMNILDADMGDKKWKSDITLEDVRINPAMDRDGTLYFVTEENFITAIDGKSGKTKWKKDMGNSVSDTPVIGPDNTLFISNNSGLKAVDSKTGNQKWKFKTKTFINSGAIFDKKGNVYAAEHGGMLYSINGKTGEKIWETKITDFIILRSPAIAPDGTIFVTDGNNSAIHAINPDTGKEKWKFESKEEPFHEKYLPFPPAFDSDGNVYIGDKAGSITALKIETGEKIWEHKTGEGNVVSSPTISPGGIVYAGDSKGIVHAFNRETGKKIWKRNVKVHLPYPIMIGPNGMVIAASHEGKIYSLEGPEYREEKKEGKSSKPAPKITIGKDFVNIGGVKLRIRKFQ
ncbi:MAG: PQQ-binding-like beta-propeller repeat protein [Candidatus Eremiobacteraeota bacterium]|nr:PQQ-binding-like beta-propeller repeat protein [Candidatus Eremiobacteraeota bacterium]